MYPVFSQATLLPHPLGVDIHAFNQGGVRSVELLLTKAEDHLKPHTSPELGTGFEDAGIRS